MKRLFTVTLVVICAAFHSSCFQRTAVFVLGMHRSGTSATAGMLHCLGISFGTNLLAPSKYNEKGHFEEEAIVTLNNKILAYYKTSWDDTDPFIININTMQAYRFKHEIKQCIQQNFSRHFIFGLKDPRLCLLLPLYIKAVQELGFMPKLIFVRRNPSEIAASLQNRDHMPRQKALQLTKKYLDAATATIQVNPFLKVLNVSFDFLLKDPLAVINQLKSFLPMSKLKRERVKSAIEFLDKNLKHYNFTPSVS